MAEVRGAIMQQNVANSQGNLGALDDNYNTLKALAKTAVLEFDDLKLKCRDYFIKYKAEHERYLKAKADLQQLKNISSLALNEYDNLQRKFYVEQECRDKAVEIASKVVGENNQLKRQSQMIINRFEDLSGEGLDLNTLQEIEKASSESDSDIAIILLQDEVKELKEKVEKLKVELKTTKTELQISKEGFTQEKAAHLMTRKKLSSNEKKLKQLNRVSVLAFEEFNVLQTKLEVETHCRAEAEKLASEAKRADEDLKRKSQIIRENTAKDDRLAKAFEEITKLNRELEEARADKEDKIKTLTEDLLLSKDGEHLKSLKEKLHLAQEEIENLENQVTEARTKAKEANETVETLKKKFDDFRRSSLPPPPPPPPTAPPPPPVTVVKKFMNIMGNKKKKGDNLRRQKKEDPLANAMKEMMDRINSGKVQLKPVKQQQRNSSGSAEDASAMTELGSLLSTLKKSSSTENLLEERSPTKTEEPCEWTSIKLRKRSEQTTERQTSVSSEQEQPSFKTSPLRKARSYSTNDLVDVRPKEDDEATLELKKILQKQKTLAERETKEKTEHSMEKEDQ